MPRLGNPFSTFNENNSKIARLRKQHDEYTKSNNLRWEPKKLETIYKDSKIPRT